MREAAQAKLEKLTKEREGVVSNLNAYNGAIEVLNQLLAEQAAQDSKVPAPKQTKLKVVPEPTGN